MGDVNGTIYEKSYRNQVVKTDIVSAFLHLHNVARSKLTSKSFAAKKLLDIHTKAEQTLRFTTPQGIDIRLGI